MVPSPELQIYTCDQGSESWYSARLGIPTASEFDTVMAKGRGGGESKTRRTYMLKLMGERLTGEPMYNYSNDHMERGKEMELAARNAYSFMTDLEPIPVGFMRRGNAGASPDSIVGDNGLVEIKTKLAHLQLEVLLADEVPPEHKAQVQGQLWISGREWVDFVSYWPGLPLFVKRVYRDEPYIEALKKAVDAFNSEMLELIERIEQSRKVA